MNRRSFLVALASLIAAKAMPDGVCIKCINYATSAAPGFKVLKYKGKPFVWDEHTLTQVKFIQSSYSLGEPH